MDGKIFLEYYDQEAQRVAAESGSIFTKSSDSDFTPGGSCDSLHTICKYKYNDDVDKTENCVLVNSTPKFNAIVSEAKSVDELKQKCATATPDPGCFEKPGPPTCKTSRRGFHV